MVAIRGHFDGKVFVPDEPVDLPRDRKLILHIEPLEDAVSAPVQSRPSTPDDETDALQWIVDHPIDDPSLPSDLSHNLHHYLYGAPKREVPPKP